MDTMTAQHRLDYMKQSILEGGVALYKGRTIGRVDDLPTLSDLATTSEERTTALSDIEARRKALDAEEARVRAASAGQPLGAGDSVTTTGPGAAGTGETSETTGTGGKRGGTSKTDAASQPLQVK